VRSPARAWRLGEPLMTRMACCLPPFSQPDRSSRRRAVTGQVAPTQPDCGKVTCGVESGHSR